MKKIILNIILVSIISVITSCKENNSDKVNPETKLAQELYDSANRKHYQKDFYGAIEDFNRAIEINPNMKDIFCNRGYSKQATGNHIGAIQDFNRCIENTKKGFNNLSIMSEAKGDSKYALGDFRGAINDYTLSNDNYPHQYPNREVVFKRGLAKLKISDYDGACNDFSISADRGYPEAFVYINEYCN